MAGFAAMLAAVAAATGCGGADDRAPDGDLGSGRESVIYGADDRSDVYSCDDAAWARRALQSSVVIMDRGTVDLGDPANVRFRAYSLGDSMGLCAGERFETQPAAGFCSGTLVAPDLVLTAGHCIRNSRDCRNARVVFRFAMASAGARETVTAEDVFGCSSIVARYESTTLDYALVRLSRPATPRFAPAPVRRGALAVGTGDRLVVIGSPSGLPLKIDDGGSVRDPRASRLDYFVANTDTFGGNSGSGVFLAATGEVAGILVRGEEDYEYSPAEDCYRVRRCAENGCGGEDITYVHRAVAALCRVLPSSTLCR